MVVSVCFRYWFSEWFVFFQFEQSGLSLASREEYFSNHSNYKKIKDGLIEFGGKIGELLGGDNSTVWSGMSDIYNLESQLAQVM